jgi:flagellar biosynthesis activator protein FlaF
MSIQAYQQVSQRAEAPRQTEYRLLAQVTRALMAAQKLDSAGIKERIDALDWNRRVWTAFSSDCARDGNGLPGTLRASIISIGLFVSRHTSEVMRSHGDISVLIDINRNIMSGLAGDVAAEADLAGAG